jgi:hypothetical protein
MGKMWINLSGNNAWVKIDNFQTIWLKNSMIKKKLKILSKSLNILKSVLSHNTKISIIENKYH